MKTLVATVLFFFAVIEPNMAQSQQFRATYEGVISTSELLKNFDSIDVLKNGVEENKIPSASVPLIEMPVMKLSVLAYKNRVVIMRMEDPNVSNPAGINSPDSSVFENNSWYVFRNGSSTPKPTFSDSIYITSDTKVISNFRCNKYIWKSNSSKRVTELWVTTELPKEISPFSVSIPVEGAIIQSRQLESNFIFRLTELWKNNN